MRTFVLGGTRSGKSGYAESLARASGERVAYVATATAGDGAMAERIALHRERRPATWTLVEEPIRLAETIRRLDGDGVTLVDCLTLWLTNLLMTDDEALVEREIDALIAVMEEVKGELILVSNETGLGITPPGELTRRYVDLAGSLHQQLAKLSDRVTLVVAGLPMNLKGA